MIKTIDFNANLKWLQIWSLTSWKFKKSNWKSFSCDKKLHSFPCEFKRTLHLVWGAKTFAKCAVANIVYEEYAKRKIFSFFMALPIEHTITKMLFWKAVLIDFFFEKHITFLKDVLFWTKPMNNIKNSMYYRCKTP